MVEHALYGRMRLSRCIDKNYGYIGCSVDMKEYLEYRSVAMIMMMMVVVIVGVMMVMTITMMIMMMMMLTAAAMQ